MRTFKDAGGNAWRVTEVDGQLGYVVGNLPPVWIDAPWPIEVLSDRELVELVCAELEPRADPMP